jgi:hypothetical protein
MRHDVIPQASTQDTLDAPSIAPAGAMTRRGVMGRALATGAGAALAVTVAPIVAAQDATPVTADEASTIETVSGQALYTLPRDHRWHGGPFYATSEYWEWHYWTGFVTDVESGEEWGLFYTW